MDRDPVTGAALPPQAIQRVLHITQKIHVYTIPPILSNKGFAAASWTANPKDNIFDARLRIIETAIPPSTEADEEKVTINILLEDPSTGELFAAVPYTHPSSVEQASDSSRFFAVRVVGGGGRKATLGIGFEERPDAFDFGVALQDARRTLRMEAPGQSGKAAAAQLKKIEEPKRDLSLKDGEMITINIGGSGGKGRRSLGSKGESSGSDGFAILPPPPYSAGKESSSSFLPPPPGTSSARAKRLSREIPKTKEPTAAELGFDDGEFGEFQ